MTPYQQYIAKSNYARYREDLQRREHWSETVDRYFDFLVKHLYKNFNYSIPTELFDKLHKGVLNLEILPSMRALMTAGPAAERSQLSTFNCSFLPIDDVKAFDEALYILMNGTGVGFSVEKKYTEKLPEIPEKLFDSETTIVVADSKEGWAKALRQLIALLYSGEIPKWDLSKVRPKGSRLRVFGGRSSGPEPLNELFKFCSKVFKEAVGRKLTTLECHDIVCKIGEVVVSGGCRRCLPEYSRVTTRTGIKAIKDIQVGEEVLSHGAVFKPVLAKECVGNKKTVTLKTQMGDFSSTPEHRWAVLKDVDTNEVTYIEAQHLTTEDRLVFCKNNLEESNFTFNIPTESYVCPYSTVSSCIKYFDISVLSDTEWAWFLGYLHGNGCVGSNKKYISFAVCKDMPETKEKVINIITKLGLHVIEQHVDEGCWKIAVSSVTFNQYWSKFKQAKKELRIPQVILNAPREIKIAYFSGLFDADGSAKTRRVGRKPLHVNSVYKQFLYDIRALLSSVNIPTYTRFRSRPEENWQDLGICSVIESEHKDALAFEMLKFSEKIKNDFNFDKSHSTKKGLSINRHTFYRSKRTRGIQGNTISWNRVQKISDWYFPIKLKEVVINEGTEVCYDLQVKDTESFVVEGLLTHNSALISLSDLSDDRMRKAKTGEWWTKNDQRRLANNSAVYTEKPDIGQFMEEWLSLYNSKSGERGIFNRYAVKNKLAKSGKRKLVDFGTNPCQCQNVSLLTPKGITTLGQINIGDVIWSGQQWTRVINKVCTGIKPVYRYSTTAGYFEGTEDHRIVQNGEKIKVKLAEAIDRCRGPKPICDLKLNPEYVMAGWIQGDGSKHSSSKYVILNVGKDDKDFYTSEYAQFITGNRKASKGNIEYPRVNTIYKIEDLVPLPERKIPDEFFYASRENVLAFLRGLYTANGSICGGRITLKSSCKKLVEQVQQMLSSVGIGSYYTTNQAKTVKFSNGDYFCKESYDLNIGTVEDKLTFQKYIGFVQQYKNEKLAKILEGVEPRKKSHKETYDIVSIDYLGEHEVFDITVEADEHTYWNGGLLVSNCGEIFLRPYGLCNLTNIIVSPEDTEETLKEKAHLASVLGTFQSTLTNYIYLRKIWQNNSEEERLLGVGLNGICGNKYLLNSTEEQLQDLRNVVIETNKKLAEELNINPSVATTCVKPDGNSSQLCGTSSGIHPWHSAYYLRRIRAEMKDPLTHYMIKIGIPHEPCVSSPDTTMIFEFPQKAPEGALLRENLTAIEHLNLWLKFQRAYTEHNPSITVSIKDHEWMEVGAWVYEHFDEATGISFLPYDGGIYRQAPYEEITKEKYEELIEKMPKDINWEEFIEVDDNVEGVQQLACVAGYCEI